MQHPTSFDEERGKGERGAVAKDHSQLNHPLTQRRDPGGWFAGKMSPRESKKQEGKRTKFSGPFQGGMLLSLAKDDDAAALRMAIEVG
jgi:hypothetical protein